MNLTVRSLPRIRFTLEFHVNLLKSTSCWMLQHVYHSTTVHSAHTVFMCFVFISEETATFALYNVS